jgi:hypothetical protein
MALLLAFVLGLGIGLVLKGINIHIVHKEPVDKPKEYNESLAKMLPADVQAYYQSTNGQNLY